MVYHYGSYGNSDTAGDIIGIAMDLDNNKLYFSKNNIWKIQEIQHQDQSGTDS